MAEAVVFDLYGTLVDIKKKREPYHKLLRRLSPRILMKYGGFEEAKRICQTENFDSLSDLSTRLVGKHVPIGFGNYEVMVHEEVQSVELFEDAKPTLAALKDKGKRLGLISNLATPYKQPVYDLGLDQYFDHVVFSCDVGHRKPEPEIYQLMLDRLDIPAEQAYMTGDKVANDVIAPLSVGMRAVLLDRKHTSFGSIRSLKDLVDLV